MTTKKLMLLLILTILQFPNLFGQAKKQTIMILPSDNWCTQRLFTTTYNNQGTNVRIPDYKKAFQEDTEIGQVVAKIGSIMTNQGFSLKDAEQEIKNLNNQSAEDAMTASNNSNSPLTESPLDILKKRAKADIILQIWWTVNKTTTGKAVSFTIEAFDAYTSKRIATATANGKPSENLIVPLLLEQAVKDNIEPFIKQLKNHFTQMKENGREIIVRIKKFESWDKNLETVINGKEISEHIIKWIQENTVKSSFNTTDASENFILFEQVKIAMYDENGKPLDARQFTKKLQEYLKSAPFNIECKLMTRGLGEAILVLGEK